MKDIKSSAREFKSMLRDLEWLRTEIERDESGSAALMAENILRQIRDYRNFDEKRLMGFKD